MLLVHAHAQRSAQRAPTRGHTAHTQCASWWGRHALARSGGHPQGLHFAHVDHGVSVGTGGGHPLEAGRH